MGISKKVIQGFIEGRKEDISLVYSEYRNLVFFVISNYIDNIEDCNDVLSETFLKAIENKNSIKEKDSLKNYLTAIAKNESINFLKKNREIPISDSDELIPYSDNKGEALSYLEPLLDKKEATVMIYHAVFGYTWKEIASELNLSESTVRNIYRDAKARLRKEYSRL